MIHLTGPVCAYVAQMTRFSRRLTWLPRTLRRRVRSYTEWFSMMYGTLCYNYFTNFMLMFETLLEPMFWFVERFAKHIGPVSVFYWFTLIYTILIL